MTHRQTLLAMTFATGLIALPALALAQGSAGSSMQPQTTQTTPQQGPLSSTAGAAAGINAGTATTQTIPGNNAGSRAAPGANPTPAATAAPGGTAVVTQPAIPAQGGSAGTTGASMAPSRDGTATNPPSTATQRAADGVTGSRTPADGTPGNPSGTAAGRAIDRTVGTNMSGANPGGTSAATPATPAAATATAGAAAGTMAVDSAALRQGRRATRVIGSNVYNDANDSVGEVDDILVGTTGAPIAIVSVGGFLGIGAKLVAVPYDRLVLNTERNRWMLTGATKESLAALPTFSYDAATGSRR